MRACEKLKLGGISFKEGIVWCTSRPLLQGAATPQTRAQAFVFQPVCAQAQGYYQNDMQVWVFVETESGFRPTISTCTWRVAEPPFALHFCVRAACVPRVRATCARGVRGECVVHVLRHWLVHLPFHLLHLRVHLLLHLLHLPRDSLVHLLVHLLHLLFRLVVHGGDVCGKQCTRAPFV